MEIIKYQIRFHDFWCTTSGLSGGAKADILTLKDPNGLPYVPGRTLKGLLREAAESLEESKLTDQETIKLLFGEREAKENDPYEKKHRKRDEGLAFFTNAKINKTLADTLGGQNVKEMLFETLTSTAIETETGIAKTHSLRRTEAVLPCTLYAEIMINLPVDENTGSDKTYDKLEQYRNQLECCMKYIKRLGHHRTRGLGRCTFSILET